MPAHRSTRIVRVKHYEWAMTGTLVHLATAQSSHVVCAAELYMSTTYARIPLPALTRPSQQLLCSAQQTLSKCSCQ
jgi:hypothetical protein